MVDTFSVIFGGVIKFAYITDSTKFLADHCVIQHPTHWLYYNLAILLTGVELHTGQTLYMIQCLLNKNFDDVLSLPKKVTNVSQLLNLV